MYILLVEKNIFIYFFTFHKANFSIPGKLYCLQDQQLSCDLFKIAEGKVPCNFLSSTLSTLMNFLILPAVSGC